MNVAAFRNFSLIALIVAFLAACAGSPQHRSTGDYIDDSVLATKVKTALINDEQVKAREIEVEVFKGVVQLSGFVHDRGDIPRAESIARGVDGVKSVKNDIRVKPR